MDVALVHWPAEAERLERLRAAREPRLVIVEHGAPPTTIDELEDWLRAPADETDVGIRLATLRERASRNASSTSSADRACSRRYTLSSHGVPLWVPVWQKARPTPCIGSPAIIGP